MFRGCLAKLSEGTERYSIDLSKPLKMLMPGWGQPFEAAAGLRPGVSRQREMVELRQHCCCKAVRAGSLARSRRRAEARRQPRKADPTHRPSCGGSKWHWAEARATSVSATYEYRL